MKSRHVKNPKGQLAALIEADFAMCLGCCNEFLLSEMHPVNDADWVCKPCYRNLLEGLTDLRGRYQTNKRRSFYV